MRKVFCIGESLIDLIPAFNDKCGYLAKAGGAPANVAACVAKLGGNGYFLGKISTDNFGDFLLEKMIDAGVNTEYVVRDGRYKTALAVVTLNKDGDRSFSFYRDNTADLMLNEKEISGGIFEKEDILHFCSVSLVESDAKNAHTKAIKEAIKKGAKISFDINIRLDLYRNAETCRKTVLEYLTYADIVKMSEDELVFLTEESDAKIAIEKIWNATNRAKILFVTRGAKGSSVYDRSGASISEKAGKTNAVDTTGAGDCFIGTMLYLIAENGFHEDAGSYEKYLRFASSACDIICSRKGAIESMPDYYEVEEYDKTKNVQ